MNQPVDQAFLAVASAQPVAQSASLPQLGHQFGSLDPAFFSVCSATALPEPYPIAISTVLAEQLGLASEDLSSATWTEVFAGNRLLPGSTPLAAVYSGHQFGVWAGQLGDGRALLLGDLKGPHGERFELQLKGAGPTPYSRMGDGRAVLRSSIREFLCSEAMAALGVPSTRALALVGSALPVIRESFETAAVVTRVAPSFVRFGSFEHWAGKGDVEHLRQLADYVLESSYPELLGAKRPYLELLHTVMERSADLVAHWQAIGFCHGVLNTDNMSILGLTLDYGPFGFLDAFDAGHICNHSDHQGRYAFAAQPQVVHWNVYCLARAMLPLIDDVAAVEGVLQQFGARFDSALLRRMRGKLGLAAPSEDDGALFDSLFELLQANHFDYTRFFRDLGRISRLGPEHDQLILDHALDTDQARSWLAQYRLRLGAEQRDDRERQLAMDQVNPKYVLRNYLAEIAIKAAQGGDFSVLARLASVLSRPFDQQPGAEDLAAPPPDWAAGLEVSCSS
jgi:uncharacterized protein YdiU (UPF0061 family)